MNHEINFLTKYGLQHYVKFARTVGAGAFWVDRNESPKMIDHAHSIIREMYDGTATVLTT